MSMLIRQEGWDPILLVGDLTYETALLEENIVPGTGDKDTLLTSFAKVRRLKERLTGLVIAASHDFAAEEAVSRATRRTSPMQEE
jgi:glyoxylase-like metal-dependent hydrolase (beta-lactamase superfamily II)